MRVKIKESGKSERVVCAVRCVWVATPEAGVKY